MKTIFENIASAKDHLRLEMLKQRHDFNKNHSASASKTAFENLKALLSPYRYVLSYDSFDSEFNTRDINRWLEQMSKLVLPKMEGSNLRPFLIQDMASQLIRHPMGMREPDVNSCHEIPLQQISCALIPAIAFDGKMHRLGYGCGYYDRFLSKLPANVVTYGLGFKEQFIDKLPTESHDIPLNSLILF